MNGLNSVVSVFRYEFMNYTRLWHYGTIQSLLYLISKSMHVIGGNHVT